MVRAGVKAIAASLKHSVVMMENGAVFVTNTAGNFYHVVARDAIAVDHGLGFTMVVVKDGSVWSAGRNDNDQLEDESTTDTPGQLSGETMFQRSSPHVMHIYYYYHMKLF